jgi:hypothetical protein
MKSTNCNVTYYVLLLPFVLGSLACSHQNSSGTIDVYSQSVGLLGRVISPVTRPLPTQDNTNTEETRKDIHASSGILTHVPSV